MITVDIDELFPEPRDPGERIKEALAWAQQHKEELGLNITTDKGDILTLALMYIVASL
jgi:hypothetical protein